MGYTTFFTGRVTVTPPLNPHEIRYLEQFSSTGSEASTRFLPDGLCDWVPLKEGSALGWNGREKFDDADLWMAYLIDTFLKPGAEVARAYPLPEQAYPEELRHFTFDHTVNGTIEAEGEWENRRWRLEVRDNAVYVIHQTVAPLYDEIDPTDPDDWGQAQFAEYAARIRHHVVYLVRDDRRHDLGDADGLGFAPVSPVS